GGGERRRWVRVRDRRHGGPAASHRHPPPPGLRHQPLRAVVPLHHRIGGDPLLSQPDSPGGDLDRRRVRAGPGYSWGTSFDLLASCSAKAVAYLPFLARLRILRQWAGVCDISPDASPIMGFTPVQNLLVTT